MGKQTKRNTLKALWMMMIVVLMITGCSTSSRGTGSGEGDGSKGKTFTSEDGQVQLTVGKTWIADPALKDQAILGVSHRKSEKYAMVNVILKSTLADDATLDDFKAVVMNNINLILTNPEELNSETITVDGTQAQVLEISGEAQKVKVQYYVALVEKGGGFYQITAWSTQSKFKANQEELLKAIESFKVLKEVAQSETSPSPAKSPDTGADQDAGTTTLTSADKKMEITLPAYMTTEMELSPNADIQASRALQEEYMMILREGKDTFADGYTLDDYYEAVINNMSETLTNSSQPTPKKIQVNGQPAVQFELNGEIDKIKISYLVTVVETDGNFTQLLFWTLQSQMDAKRDMFLQATDTFKELP